MLAEYDCELLADGRRSEVTERMLMNAVFTETRCDWLYDAVGRLTREEYDAPGAASDFATDNVLDPVSNRLAKRTDMTPRGEFDARGQSVDKLTEYRNGQPLNVDEKQYNSFGGVLAILLCIALAGVLSGCVRQHRPRELTGGAESIEELVLLYRDAHLRGDMNALREICWWEAAMPRGMPHNPHLEKPMVEILDMSLGDVRFVPIPPCKPHCEKVVYRIRGTEKSDGMIGPVFGRLLLIEAVFSEREPYVMDPAYIVMRASANGRYYIDILLPVAEDAVRAYKTNTPPIYVPTVEDD